MNKGNIKAFIEAQDLEIEYLLKELAERAKRFKALGEALKKEIR